MSIENDFAALGLAATATLAEVNTAFREKAKADHPDAGGTAEAFMALRQAHKRAAAWAMRPRPCEACRGTGWLRRPGSFESKKCKSCKGTGKTRPELT